MPPGGLARSFRTRAPWLLVVPFFVWSSPSPGSIAIGAPLAAVGLALRAWSAGVIRKGAALATTGPYAHTRNPLYLGSLLVGLGLTAAGGHWIWPVLFLVGFAMVYGPTMGREAAELRDAYGAVFERYEASVPVFLPRIGPRRPDVSDPASSFSWRRYGAYREWEALLGTSAVMAVLAAKVLLNV